MNNTFDDVVVDPRVFRQRRRQAKTAARRGPHTFIPNPDLHWKTNQPHTHAREMARRTARMK